MLLQQKPCSTMTNVEKIGSDQNSICDVNVSRKEEITDSKKYNQKYQKKRLIITHVWSVEFV